MEAFMVCYPARRETEFSHVLDGVECFEIREYRADGIIMSLKRVFPCLLAEEITDDLIWADMEMEFRCQLDKIHEHSA